ncbi:hypothetical protein K402DRAFT_406421 [Aulographum hederae CBS 113979]|uniref:Uncharacterized protein n=1 Tax=Aulographum hederae CBS 113979 TaxID=1176131 RepID=A0A6G1GSP0_9PEZI|nr:hypothetical protein K402DRAFT_406421 [Aulographum hederae CBS 113979]
MVEIQREDLAQWIDESAKGLKWVSKTEFAVLDYRSVQDHTAGVLLRHRSMPDDWLDEDLWVPERAEWKLLKWRVEFGNAYDLIGLLNVMEGNILYEDEDTWVDERGLYWRPEWVDESMATGGGK